MRKSLHPAPISLAFALLLMFLGKDIPGAIVLAAHFVVVAIREHAWESR